MKFGIYSKFLVDDVVLTGKKSILVRIFSNSHDYYDLKSIDSYSNVLDLFIEDVCIQKDDIESRRELIESFSKLNEFILSNDFDEVIVHCTLGISRSPAIMICISKILGCIEMEKIVKENFRFYNKIIVNEFEKYKYLKKDINIDKVIFKGYYGHSFDESWREFLIVNECEETVDLVLKRKR